MQIVQVYTIPYSDDLQKRVNEYLSNYPADQIKSIQYLLSEGKYMCLIGLVVEKK